jgi:hypothetical protein
MDWSSSWLPLLGSKPDWTGLSNTRKNNTVSIFNVILPYFMAYYAKYLYHILVFKGPVQSSFFAPFG